MARARINRGRHIKGSKKTQKLPKSRENDKNEKAHRPGSELDSPKAVKFEKGGLTAYKGGKQLAIPFKRYVACNVNNNKTPQLTKLSKPFALTVELEQNLVTHKTTMQELGFGLAMYQIREVAFELAKSDGRENFFPGKDQVVSKKWWSIIAQSRYGLSVRSPENLSRELTISDASGADDRFRDGLYQSFVSLGILSLYVHTGISLTFSTILYPQLNIDKYQDSWIAGLLAVGVPIGSSLMGPMMEKIGRKRTAIFSATLIAITWAMITLLPANFNLKLLYAIRFIVGVADGLIVSVIVYTSEVTNKHWRSVLLAASNFYMSGGIFITTTVGLILPWRSFALFSFIISLFNIVFLLFVPESPYWLFQSCPEKAKRVLMKLNKNKQDLDEEWENLKARKQAGEKTLKKMRLLSREVRRPMLHLILVFALQQFAGASLVGFYASQMFQTVVQSSPIVPSASNPTVNQTFTNLTHSNVQPTEVKHRFRFDDPDTLCLIGVGVIRFVMSAVAVLLSKHVNNRSILISSAVGNAVSAFAFSAVFSGMLGPVMDVVPLSFILLFLLFNSYGLLVVPWKLLGELIPQSYRAKGGGIITACAYGLTFVTVKTYPYAVDLVGLSGVFAFFGMVAILLCFQVYFNIPETRGKTFKEIEDFFK